MQLIGSGAIEAAHRNVIQKRLKLSGQRWTIKGAQQITNLRTYKKSPGNLFSSSCSSGDRLRSPAGETRTCVRQLADMSPILIFVMN